MEIQCLRAAFPCLYFAGGPDMQRVARAACLVMQVQRVMHILPRMLLLTHNAHYADD